MRPYVGYVVFLLFLVNVANYGQRMILAILSPAIQADMGLADWQLGVLMGGGFALIYALAGVPLARLADQHSRVRGLALAMLVWSAAMAVFGGCRTFLELLAARAGLAAAQSVGIPVSHSLIADYVSTRSRPLVLALHSSGGVLGVTLASMIGGHLEARMGWRAASVTIGVTSAALAGIVLITLREPRRGGPVSVPVQGAADSFALRDIVRHLVAIRSYPWILLAISFATLVEFGTNQWLPSYYVRQFSLPLEEVGFRYGLAVALGGIPGSVVGGILASALMRRDVRWLGWLPAVLYVFAIPLGLGMLLARNASTALVLNGLYAFAVFATNGPVWAASFTGVPPLMRATTSALTLLVSGVTGLALGPTLVGLISDALAARAGVHALQGSLVAVETLAVGVVVSLLFAAAHLQRAGPDDYQLLTSRYEASRLKEPP